VTLLRWVIVCGASRLFNIPGEIRPFGSSGHFAIVERVGREIADHVGHDRSLY
jgi:hypothetical protein